MENIPTTVGPSRQLTRGRAGAPPRRPGAAPSGPVPGPQMPGSMGSWCSHPVIRRPDAARATRSTGRTVPILAPIADPRTALLPVDPR